MDTQQQIERLRTRRAAEWLQALREADDAATREQFMRWITESPLNLEEYLQLEALSRETGELLRGGLYSLPATGAAPAKQVVAFPRAEDASTLLFARHRTRRFSLPGIAASIVLAGVGGWLVFDQWMSWDRYATGPQQRMVELRDGSLVYLNANSTLRVRLTHAERDLRLGRGEALFDVAKDTHRPFRVRTRYAIIEALGTQFNVNTAKGATQVAVLQGKVRVIRDGAPAEADLGAGELVRLDQAGAVSRDRPDDIRTVAAWNRPELVFAGTSLEQAVAEFNRHRRATPLRLEDIPERSRHYSGIFYATDSESFASLLAHEEDLAVEYRTDEIVIRRR